MKKKTIILTLLCLCIVLLSCGKTTEPVIVVQKQSTFSFDLIPSMDILTGRGGYTLGLIVDSNAFGITEANFTIGYDKRFLEYRGTYAGDYFTDNHWDYFYFEHIETIPEANDTNISFINIHVKKDVDKNPGTPSSFFDGALFEMFFEESMDITTLAYTTVSFYWGDCDRNQVFFNGEYFPARINDVYYPHRDISRGYNSYWGGYSHTCENTYSANVETPILNFEGIALPVMFDPYYAIRGDINANNIQNEIADAVMYSNYFVFGELAFGDHVQGSTNAADVNYNQIPLELADLVYMIRIIVGDALPWTDLQPIASTCTLGEYPNQIRYSCPVDIGAIHLRFLTNGSVRAQAASYGMDVISNRSNDTLDVLVYNIGDQYIPAGTGAFLELYTSSPAELIDAEVSSYEGVNIPVVIQ